MRERRTGARPPSLLANIARGLVMVSALAVVTTAVLLYAEFKGTHDLMRQRTLANVTTMIERFARLPDGRLATSLPDSLRVLLRDSAVSFAVVDEGGAVVLGSDGVTAPLYPIGHHRTREYFRLSQSTAPSLNGLSRRVGDGAHSFWIQVATGDEEMHVESLIEEFIDHLAWIWVPFVIVLFAVNLWIIHRGLRPLRRASAYAAAIGPDSVSQRLPEDGMPREVLPLVRAVNLALSRLETGYRAQRAFIADAAHELRTPLAVLEAHLALMDDKGAALRGDVAAMKRLVDQLLDLARLDALRIGPDEIVDLQALAVDVASHLAPLTLQNKRLIEVVGCEHPVPVRGAYDPLFRALRNLVENAVAHAPAGSTVSVAVQEAAELRVTDHGPGVPPQQRDRIFERFWQGGGDHAARAGGGGGGGGGGGAGLGLSIVARTMAAHGGRVEIDEAPGGGAVFILRFPPATMPQAAVSRP